MKQFKKIVLLIFSLLFITAFVACSNGDSGNSEEDDKAGNTEICTWMLDIDSEFTSYTFYSDGTGVMYANYYDYPDKSSSLAFTYEGNPTKEGTVLLQIFFGEGSYGTESFTLAMSEGVLYANGIYIVNVTVTENSGGKTDTLKDTCTWVQDTDASNYFIFYADGTVEYYIGGKLEYDRPTLSYEGSPTESGTVTIKVNTGVALFTFTVTKSDDGSISAAEQNFGLTYTMGKDSDDDTTDGGGDDTPSLMFMGFDNVVTIENGTDITGITTTIYSLTSDTTLKFKGGINSITLTTVAAAIGTNDSVKIALDFSETTGITEWTNKLAGQKTLYAISLPGTVTSVADNAFDECTNLKAITIPYTITGFPSVDSDIIVNFGGTLTDWLNGTLVCPDKCTLYLNGEELSGEVTIPDSVTAIRSEAFKYCSKITSIEIPNSVTKIGNNSFYGCSSLKAVYYSGSQEQWLAINFNGNYSNPCNSGAKLFCNGTYTIPDGVTNIEDYEFSDCTALTNIIIPNTVTEIGDYAFYGCSGLTSIIIPDSVTSLGLRAFASCSGLTSITIPSTLTSIASCLFEGCSGLTSITIPDSVTEIGNYAFSGCSELTSVIIPDGITTIETATFQSCNKLTSITIPATVTKITEWAFNGCWNLATINFRGTETQWQAIDIESFCNEYLLTATIVYNYTGD